jgi:hypothetical protein
VEAAVADERAREMDEHIVELTWLQAETAGGMQTMAEVFGIRQGDFVRVPAERIDGLQPSGTRASATRPGVIQGEVGRLLEGVGRL